MVFVILIVAEDRLVSAGFAAARSPCLPPESNDVRHSLRRIQCSRRRSTAAWMPSASPRLLRSRRGDLVPFLRGQPIRSLDGNAARELHDASGNHRLDGLFEGFQRPRQSAATSGPPFVSTVMIEGFNSRRLISAIRGPTRFVAQLESQQPVVEQRNSIERRNPPPASTCGDRHTPRFAGRVLESPRAQSWD